jgi:hypothetical protein
MLMSIVLAALLSACEPNVKVKRIQDAPALAADCTPTVFELRDVTPTDVELLAQIATSDSGGTAGGSACSQHVIRELLRQNACAVGADAIKITAESFPRLFGSGCYKAKADLYRFVRRAAPAPRAPAVAPRADKITRIKELQKLRDEGAITDAEFQRLKQDILREP